MSQIKIDYNEVFTKTAKMRNQLSMSLRQMEAEYRQVQSRLSRGTDGATAAAIGLAVNENMRKTREVAETLDKLLSFMRNSARQVELEELKIANVFRSGAR